MTFHFPDEVDTNVLTIDATDPKSGTAEFKAGAIRVDKIASPSVVETGRIEERRSRGLPGTSTRAAAAPASERVAQGGDGRRREKPAGAVGLLAGSGGGTAADTVLLTADGRSPSRGQPASGRRTAGRAGVRLGRRRARSAARRAPRPGGHRARDRRDELLPALHAVQEHVGWISPGALNYVCERLTVPPADAYGVATFYALFSLDWRPPRVVHVCEDLACKCRGSDELIAELEDRFGPEGTIDRGRGGDMVSQPVSRPVRPGAGGNAHRVR